MKIFAFVFVLLSALAFVGCEHKMTSSEQFAYALATAASEMAAKEKQEQATLPVVVRIDTKDMTSPHSRWKSYSYKIFAVCYTRKSYDAYIKFMDKDGFDIDDETEMSVAMTGDTTIITGKVGLQDKLPSTASVQFVPTPFQ